jgi:hypothetical protein
MVGSNLFGFAAGPENIGSTFLKQGLPRRDLVRMAIYRAAHAASLHTVGDWME